MERKGEEAWGRSVFPERGDQRPTWGRVKDSRGEINWIGGGWGGVGTLTLTERKGGHVSRRLRARRGTLVLLPLPGVEGKTPTETQHVDAGVRVMQLRGAM